MRGQLGSNEQLVKSVVELRSQVITDRVRRRKEEKEKHELEFIVKELEQGLTKIMKAFAGSAAFTQGAQAHHIAYTTLRNAGRLNE